MYYVYASGIELGSAAGSVHEVGVAMVSAGLHLSTQLPSHTSKPRVRLKVLLARDECGSAL